MQLCATCHQPIVNKEQRYHHMPVREGALTCASCHNTHGSQNVRLLRVGTTVDEACFWFLSMERSCQAQLMAMAAGTPKLIDHKMAQYTFEQTGFHEAGWFSFQPMWNEICRTDPDLFD